MPTIAHCKLLTVNCKLLPNQLYYLQIQNFIAINTKTHHGAQLVPTLFAGSAGIQMQAADLFIINHF